MQIFLISFSQNSKEEMRATAKTELKSVLGNMRSTPKAVDSSRNLHVVYQYILLFPQKFC